MRICRVLLLVAVVAVPGVARAAAITVTTTADELNVDGDCSLREAVTAANSDTAVDACAAGSGADVVTLPAGTYAFTVTGASENAAATGDLDLTGQISIAGDGPGSTILEGNSDDRMFEVRSGATVTLSGMTMRLSTPAQAGGVIHNRSSLTITDCAFEDNAATGTVGGAIYSLSSTTLDISDSVFSGNSAGGDGGAISSGGTVTSSGVTFAMNLAGGQGGALYISPNGTLTMDGSELTGNEAEENGGGIAQYGPATITDSTIQGNRAGVLDLGGAGIYCSDPLSLSRSLVANNTSEASGGGILVAGVSCVATLTNVTVYGNLADDNGGGIRLAGGGDVTLNNATVAGNSADDDMSGSGNGGGIDQASGGTVTLRNSVVAGNTDAGAASDCNGTLTSQGHNLLESTSGCTMAAATGDITGMAPALGPLQDNGGPTLTAEPDAGSPLLEAGDPATPGSGGTACESVDQRHFGRPAASLCDIGAVERGAVLATTTTTSSSTSTTSTTSTTTTSTTTTSAPTTTSSTMVTTTTVASSSTTTVPTSSSTLPPPSSTSTTTLPPPFCANGASMRGVTLTLQKLGAPQGNEKMVLKGTLQVLANVPFDPATHGMQLLVEDVAGQVPLLALTTQTTPLAALAGCASSDGWSKATYRNRSGALPPACAPGSAGGLRKLKLKDKRASGGGITFRGQVKNGNMPAPGGPLRIAVALGVPQGPCVTHTFAAGACVAKGASYRCK